MTTPLGQLLAEFPDSRRLPPVVESVDWGKISPALVNLVSVAPSMLETAEDARGWANLARVTFEIVYAMGYERGKAERGKVKFVVGTPKRPPWYARLWSRLTANT